MLCVFNENKTVSENSQAKKVLHCKKNRMLRCNPSLYLDLHNWVGGMGVLGLMKYLFKFGKKNAKSLHNLHLCIQSI